TPEASIPCLPASFVRCERPFVRGVTLAGVFAGVELAVVGASPLPVASPEPEPDLAFEELRSSSVLAMPLLAEGVPDAPDSPLDAVVVGSAGVVVVVGSALPVGSAP